MVLLLKIVVLSFAFCRFHHYPSMSFSRWVVTVRFYSCDDFVWSPSAPQSWHVVHVHFSMLLFFFHVDSIILGRVECPCARFTLLSYVCVYFVLNELFLWLDETPLRSRGIFGATSWHVVQALHSMLLFFCHFAQRSVCLLRGLHRCRICSFVVGVSNRLTLYRRISVT